MHNFYWGHFLTTVVLETKIRHSYVPIEQLQKNSEIQTSDLTVLSIMALIIRYLVSLLISYFDMPFITKCQCLAQITRCLKVRDGQNEMIQVDMYSVDTHFILQV